MVMTEVHAIGFDEYDISMEDLIPDDKYCYCNDKTWLHQTYECWIISRASIVAASGIKGMETIDDDYIEELFMTTSHHYLMFFTNTGRVYRMKAYEIPEASRTARGTAIINLLQLAAGVRRSQPIIPIKEYQEDWYLFMATQEWYCEENIR